MQSVPTAQASVGMAAQAVHFVAAWLQALRAFLTARRYQLVQRLSRHHLRDERHCQLRRQHGHRAAAAQLIRVLCVGRNSPLAPAEGVLPS
jgi:hypothetical protein